MKKLIAALGLLLVFLSMSGAAPAPMPKPLRNLNKWDFVGGWKYKYGNSEGEFVFYGDGFFRNNLGSAKFVGTWDVQDNSVVMMEKTMWQDPCSGAVHYGTEIKYTFKFNQTSLKKGQVKILEGPSFTGDSPTSNVNASLQR